ncbi:hypothetical protein ScPMuIL_003932 [Solemya velum]
MSVKTSTVVNCWRHVQILPISATSNEGEEDDDMPLAELQQLLRRMPTEDRMEAAEFLSVDNDVATGETLTDDHIIELVNDTPDRPILSDDSSDDDDIDEILVQSENDESTQSPDLSTTVTVEIQPSSVQTQIVTTGLETNGVSINGQSSQTNNHRMDTGITKASIEDASIDYASDITPSMVLTETFLTHDTPSSGEIVTGTLMSAAETGEKTTILPNPGETNQGNEETTQSDKTHQYISVTPTYSNEKSQYAPETHQSPMVTDIAGSKGDMGTSNTIVIMNTEVKASPVYQTADVITRSTNQTTAIQASPVYQATEVNTNDQTWSGVDSTISPMGNGTTAPTVDMVTTDPVVLTCYEATCDGKDCLTTKTSLENATCSAEGSGSCYVKRTTTSLGNHTTEAGCSSIRCVTKSDTTWVKYCCHDDRCNQDERNLPSLLESGGCQLSSVAFLVITLIYCLSALVVV